MRSAASVKDRLKQQSRSSGKTMQELLVAYALERTIYRVSISKYSDNFTLKGGIFLYAVFERNYARVTTDIDFLARKLNNETENIRRIFEEIFSIRTDDPLVYDMSTLYVNRITEFKDYHGVNVSIIAYLDKTRINVSIDIGFGDVIYPERVIMDFPVILDDAEPKIFAYSLSSCIAEKFEAIVSLGYDNSRFKDFYDICMLAQNNVFDGKELTEAIKQTFEQRRTVLNDIVVFETGFAEDRLRQSRWNAFIKKKKALKELSLHDAIGIIEDFLLPVTDAINSQITFDQRWDNNQMQWTSRKS